MPNDVINTRRVGINVSNSNNNQPRRPQVRRRATPPAQPRPVSRNLQVPRVPNILSNLSPFRRTKSTRSTRKKIKGYKDTPSQGKKRKTKVNVAKKSKRASQKKRGRSGRGRKSQRGGDKDQIITFKGLTGHKFNHPDAKNKLITYLEGYTVSKKFSRSTILSADKLGELKDFLFKEPFPNYRDRSGEYPDIPDATIFRCEYLGRKFESLNKNESNIDVGKYVNRLISGKHLRYPDAEITCDTQEYTK